MNDNTEWLGGCEIAFSWNDLSPKFPWNWMRYYDSGAFDFSGKDIAYEMVFNFRMRQWSGIYLK